MKFILPALFGLIIILAGLRLFPRAAVWSDEAAYIATANRIHETGRLYAATHLPEDIEAAGINHKPIHMPFYMILLAIWIKFFPDSRNVLLFNQLLFALTVMLLWGFLSSFTFALNVRSLLCFGVVACLPLGFVYSNTGMMESIVLLLGVLSVVVWHGSRRDLFRLYSLYALGFLSLMTRETLVLLPLSIVAANGPEVVSLHRRVLGKSLWPWILHLCLLAALIWLAYLGVTHKGFYPYILRVMNF